MFDVEEASRPPGVPTADRPLERLETEICELSGHVTAATCRWLLLIAEYDRREGWGTWGVRSCAHWLSWRCGLGLVAARDHVRVAHALETLPRICAEFAAGRLSYSKVRALTRIAVPDTEEDLVEIALHATAAQVERIARGYRRAQTIDEVEARHRRRRLQWHWDDDGSLVIGGRLSPEDGAVFLAALDAARSTDPEAPTRDDSAESSTGSAESADRRSPSLPGLRGNADALVRMAETVLAHGPAPAPGGERHQIIVHVDADTLGGDDSAESSEPAPPAGSGHPTGDRCHLDNGPALHPETVRRMACEAAIVAMLHGDRGRVLDVGRRTRVISPALRRALIEPDGGCCRFPGCTECRWVDAHHVRHWSRGGETNLDNLVLLCRFHHRLVHEGGYQIAILGPGRFQFLRPDGQRIPTVPQPPRCDGNIQRVHAATITSDTIESGWAGDNLDLDSAIRGLLDAAGVSRIPPAGPEFSRPAGNPFQAFLARHQPVEGVIVIPKSDQGGSRGS